jgi:predicted ribosome quality control (RQC) complex YloA/Tae2 family protein
VNLSLSKCCQTSDGRLVFQCSAYDQGQRRKGHLILNPADEVPARFSTEKPETALTSNGVAAIIRKHAPTARLAAIAISTDDSGQTFLRLTLMKNQGDNEPSQVRQPIYVTVCTKPERQIDVIFDAKSQARLKQNAQYTVKKPAAPEILDAVDLDHDAFLYWLRDLVAEQPKSPYKPTAEQHTPQWRKLARERVTRRLKTLKKTLLQDQQKLPSSADLTQAEEDARLLQAYLWMVKPEMTALHLDEAMTGGQPRVIELNPEKNPGANLESFYVRLKKMRRAMDVQGPRVSAIKSEIQRFEDAQTTLRDLSLPIAETEGSRILENLGLTPKTKFLGQKNNAPKKTLIGRRFLATGGAVITIGRDASESDQIVKAASSKDWWVHIAGGGHGSHAIINGPTTRDTLPTATFRDAAILALHFSDRSNAHEGEVYLTRRHQIKKRKGMPPGLWIIERAETILVRYSDAELATVFAREIREGLQRETARYGHP